MSIVRLFLAFAIYLDQRGDALPEALGAFGVADPVATLGGDDGGVGERSFGDILVERLVRVKGLVDDTSYAHLAVVTDGLRVEPDRLGILDLDLEYVSDEAVDGVEVEAGEEAISRPWSSVRGLHGSSKDESQDPRKEGRREESLEGENVAAVALASTGRPILADSSAGRVPGSRRDSGCVALGALERLICRLG